MSKLVGKLQDIVNLKRSFIVPGTVCVLKDKDGHFSLLYFSGGRIAFQFQAGFSPVVFPEPEYEVVGLCPGYIGDQFVFGTRTELPLPEVEA